MAGGIWVSGVEAFRFLVQHFGADRLVQFKIRTMGRFTLQGGLGLTSVRAEARVSGTSAMTDVPVSRCDCSHVSHKKYFAIS